MLYKRIKIDESNMETLENADKRKRDINRDLDKMTRNTYFNGIPIERIQNILSNYQIVMLQEDYTEWSGWLTGDEGRDEFLLGHMITKEGQFYTPYSNALLVLTWYKMDSGRYEIVTYVS